MMAFELRRVTYKALFIIKSKPPFQRILRHRSTATSGPNPQSSGVVQRGVEDIYIWRKNTQTSDRHDHEIFVIGIPLRPHNGLISRTSTPRPRPGPFVQSGFEPPTECQWVGILHQHSSIMKDIEKKRIGLKNRNTLQTAWHAHVTFPPGHLYKPTMNRRNQTFHSSRTTTPLRPRGRREICHDARIPKAGQ